MANNNISFVVDENTIYIQSWDLTDMEDWGASMSDFRIGFTRAELMKKSLHVEGSPAAIFSERFYIAPKEAIMNKIGYDGKPYVNINWDLTKEVPKDLWELLIPTA